MIEMIASGIVDLMIRKSKISVQESAVYQYGYELLLSSILTGIITIIVGAIFHKILASILFLGIFSGLRMLCGGYHAETYFKCNCIYTAVITVAMLFVSLISPEYIWGFHVLFVVFSIVVTWFYAPVENESKRLNDHQRLKFRYLSMLFVVLLSTCSTYLGIISLGSMGIVVDVTLFCVAFSMFITNPRREGEKK